MLYSNGYPMYCGDIVRSTRGTTKYRVVRKNGKHLVIVSLDSQRTYFKKQEGLVLLKRAWIENTGVRPDVQHRIDCKYMDGTEWYNMDLHLNGNNIGKVGPYFCGTWRKSGKDASITHYREHIPSDDKPPVKQDKPKLKTPQEQELRVLL